jgi:Zn-dependent protease with chaperone function
MTSPSTNLPVDYFDGHSARPHRVHMWIDKGMLQLSGRDLIRQVPLAQIRWPERTRHGIRLAHFEDGGSVQALDAATWDAWCRGHDLGESLVVKAQQSWRWTMVAAAMLLMVTVMGYWWGLPLAARAVAPLIPVSVDIEVGDAALQVMDARWLKPSALPAAEQSRWRQRFDQAFSRHALASLETSARASTPSPTLAHLPIHLHFRQGRIGPNAFALPNGSIIVTDELIALLQDREDVLLGVIGHEMGHVVLRHGMRTLIQTSLLGAATSVALGDFSSVLAGAPALIGHLAYSREHEREADEAAIAFLRHNAIRPSVMTVLFERLTAYRQSKRDGKPASPAQTEANDADNEDPTDLLGITFSSHPSDAERIARFRQADIDADADAKAHTGP